MVSIRFNHPNGTQPDSSTPHHLECAPNDEFPYIISIDNRLTLAEMKQSMCEMLKLDPNTVIVRRGGKAGTEVKDLKS